MTGDGIATVARQELRLRLRAGRWRVLLGVWFALLLLFTALLQLAVGRLDSGEAHDKGIVVYGGLVLLVLGLALLVVPALAAQSVNGDRERGTLATLQVTRLSAGDIALGKFAAAWGTGLVFLLVTLPLVVFCMTQGGVPLARVVVVTVVLAVLLGTVSALALALSALLARTTTSGVLSYLAVFALVFGTLIAFGLATAVTAETHQETFDNQCPPQAQECQAGPQTYTTTRTRTDRTWWLLAPNPFVVLADAAPQLAPLTAAQQADRERLAQQGSGTTDLRDVDPLGQLGRTLRNLRRPPQPDGTPTPPADLRRPVWPYGLAFDVLLAVGALALTTRRLRTPSTRLPRGQRIA